MAAMNERLSALALRLERMSEAPEQVRPRFSLVLGPVLRLFGWEPQFKVDALLALLDALKHEIQPGKRRVRDTDAERHAQKARIGQCEKAVDELEANIEAAERACVVKGYLPTARAAWLRRVYELCARAASAAAHPNGEAENRFVFSIDSVVLLPPLSLLSPDEGQKTSEQAAAEAQGAPPRAAHEIDPSDSRLLDIHLAAVDHLLDGARSEREMLGRKRAMLEGARRLLLDAAAAFPLESKGVQARSAYIAEQIGHINQLAAAGVSPSVGLLHQAKTALSRGDRRLLRLSLNELDRIALQNGDDVTAAHTFRALKAWSRGQPGGSRARGERRLLSSAREMFGTAFLQRIQAGYEAARRDTLAPLKKAGAEEIEHRQWMQQYFNAHSEEATFAAALSVDGFFDVGGALSPVRALEMEERLRLVSYPTQELVLSPAQSIGDVSSALIDDPRRILLSLAEGRLLSRKYVLREQVPRHKTHLMSEVRIYLLDGSDSMLEGGKGVSAGARARVRDAILLAELAALQQRYSMHRRNIRIVLYYRYFTKVLWPLVKVDSIDGALQSMAEIVRTPRRGGTDIEGALLASFELLRKAKEADPDLSRAQIVLVTDGNAIVREDVIRAAREPSKEVPLCVSVIALGEENASLRGLVARQRQRGERAFYHFIDDAALARMTEGGHYRNASFFLDEQRALDSKKTKDELIAELSMEAGGLLDELAALDKKRHSLVLEPAESGGEEVLASLREVGLSPQAVFSEAAKARREAAARDRLALGKRFLYWFPILKDENTAEPSPAPALEAAERADLDSVLIVLATITDIVSEFTGPPLGKQVDAIELLERLLPDARLSPSRWATVLRNHSDELKPALSALHQAVGFKSPASRSSGPP